jgi:hypothetical protein
MLVTSERGESLRQYMGWSLQIANPIARVPEENRVGSPGRLSEQRVGGGAVGGGLAAMRRNPRDFRFEQGGAIIQLGLRIGAEIFGGEARGCVAFGSGEIGFFHSDAASQAKRLAVNRQGGYSRLRCG